MEIVGLDEVIPMLLIQQKHSKNCDCSHYSMLINCALGLCGSSWANKSLGFLTSGAKWNLRVPAV